MWRRRFGAVSDHDTVVIRLFWRLTDAEYAQVATQAEAV